MTDAEQAGFESGITEEAGSTPLGAPSRDDYALYIGEMSADLARLADSGRLPQVVGHCLRVAALAANETAKVPGSGPRRGKAKA